MDKTTFLEPIREQLIETIQFINTNKKMFSEPGVSKLLRDLTLRVENINNHQGE